MKVLFKLFLSATLCCLLSGLAYAQSPQPPLTNASVVKLVRAGFKEKTVIAIINSRPSNFRLEPEQLIELKRSGVSENIILAMLGQDESFALTDDDWSLDSTFGRERNRGTDGSQPQSGDVFGSGSGSRGQSSGRGMSSANEQDTTTTGSATVRILRPPSEANGAPLKMEKTPTLDNEAVIKLVEAGFSEGTIIKRIEDSPADFDLSAAKVAELRRRRVPDSIITAMTAAMSDEPGLRKGVPKPKGN